MTQAHQVYFEAERLKYKNVGLYHFCLHLGNALLDMAARDASLQLKMYAPRQAHLFDQSACYQNTSALHKIFHPFEKKPQVWHCTYQLSPYIPKQKSIRKVLTVHDLNFLHEKKPDKQTKYRQNLQSNIDASDTIVCISKYVENELRENIDLRGKVTQVIYNGNNIRSSTSPQAPHITGLDLSRPFIFSIAAISRKKNLHTLPYLLVGNNLLLVISGMIADKEYFQEILLLSQKLGVSERVFFTGAVSEEEKYYLLQHCHLFCFPSIAEGFGLPMVEAMNFGTRILSSPATSLPEIGGSAVDYFDNFDPDYLIALGNEIQTWKSEEKRSDRIARSKLFCWENAAHAYWEEYKNLL